MSSSGNDLFAGLSLATSAASTNSEKHGDSSIEPNNNASSRGYIPPATTSLKGKDETIPSPPPTVISPTTEWQTIQKPKSPSTSVRNAPVTDKLLNLLGEGSQSLISSPVPSRPPPSPMRSPGNAISPVATSSPKPVMTTTDSVPLPPLPKSLSPAKFAPAAKKQTGVTKKRAAKVTIGTRKNEKLPSPVVATFGAVPSDTDKSMPAPNGALKSETKKDETIDANKESKVDRDGSTEPKKEKGSRDTQIEINNTPIDGNTAANSSTESTAIVLDAKPAAKPEDKPPPSFPPTVTSQKEEAAKPPSTSPPPITTQKEENTEGNTATSPKDVETGKTANGSKSKAKESSTGIGIASSDAAVNSELPNPPRSSEKPPVIVDESGTDCAIKQRSSLRGVGKVKIDTPIPNCDVALKIFNKFAQKTRANVPESHGGTQRLSLWTRYVSGTPTEYDTRFDAYLQFIKSIGIEVDDENKESDGADAVSGGAGDTMQKARNAVASFCHLLSVWGHASSRMANMPEKKGVYETFCGMINVSLDTATSLVSHGCLDGVLIGLGPNNDEYHKAVHIMAESVFSGHQSQQANELAAMKFLLSTGCRVGEDGEAMLRGSHLLQTIRCLYHVFLSTPIEANKTTARASLQQLVTSVFIRMIHTAPSLSHDIVESEYDHSQEIEKVSSILTEGIDEEGGPIFPSKNHRDAFLVLRSLCKLSMRVQPSGDRTSHSGLETSGSNVVWDSSKDPTGRSPINAREIGYDTYEGESNKKMEGLQNLYSRALHPVLESKILALDLLLYVLKRTDMGGSFLQECGPQFHYAIRNYLCVSLLKNCTFDDTTVVKLSLLVFVPIFQNFRSILKAEIEAFVTNVFFVILDSKNSPIEHKNLVVTLFNEICSDPTTLAEIFLNYDCDLSAVDLFHRIINTLSKVARMTDADATDSSPTTMTSLISGSGGARMERIRTQHRDLRLAAMKALRQVLASLNASIVEPMHVKPIQSGEEKESDWSQSEKSMIVENGHSSRVDSKKSLVEIYDDKKKRREEDSEIVLRFNQKPKAGIAYAQKCGHIDSSDPADVARFLLKNKDRFEKTQIGEYLGREPDYDNGMPLKVLHEYVNQMDFDGLQFDNSIRHYLSGFRLPGEAQKIDRILEKFAERYSEQNPNAFPSADVAFILSFSIIMLNTDLHNPSIKEERKMTKDGFIRNNRGICDGQDLPKEMLTNIFDRIKENPISLKEDDDARERAADPAKATNALSPAVFFTNHYEEMDKTKESNFMKERDQIVRTTESLLKRRRHGMDKAGRRKSRSSSIHSKSLHLRYVRTDDSGLRDEYVAPMFDVTWGPALAAFSTAMESANGTVGALLDIASDKELEAAAVNAAETIEVCLTGFRFAICTAGLVGNAVARDSFMSALSRFSQLGTGVLLEPRHVRCIQTMVVLARSDGELLGRNWEYVFRALSEINRFHQLFQLMARNDRVVAAAAERRKARLQAREERKEKKERRRAEKEDSESLDLASISNNDSSDSFSSDPGSLFDESDDFSFNDDMDTKEIDEANARLVYEAVAEDIIEAIYERSSSMSTTAVKEFILQLCRVSRMEISDFGGFVGSDSNQISLTSVKYRRKHELLAQSPSIETEGFHHQQTNIFNLQKLVEVTHYNMDSRPRLVFNDIWTTVSASLTSTALHSNPAVAMYAVDSFRQLCTQYLQREELGVFEFQRRFLKPLETVMARSEISSTKELLLRCVERIILMFGSPQDGNKGGMLRSGWRPVLKVLGLAGRDSDEEIAKMGFQMLNAQLDVCLDQCKSDGANLAGQGILLVERFVDLVDALLTFVAGPHEEMSLESIDDLSKLCDFLADESTVSPLLRKRRGITSSKSEGKMDDKETTSNQVLELWWPILLGLSRSVGDARKKVRQKSLASLTKIVSTHFFPPNDSQEPINEESKSKYIQTLQLVYRGIFSSVLEFGDDNTQYTKNPQLPSDLERFLGPKISGDPPKSNETITSSSWVDTMFDPFMDDCIHICLRSIAVLGDDTLIEDIFAMFNSCLISDSGALAVKGLRRLEIFITSDLRTNAISDDTWATVSHMLRRCLIVRDLPRKPSHTSSNGKGSGANPADDDNEDDGDNSSINPELEYQQMIREFVSEDSMFADRRYIGSNTISVIGKFMVTERFDDLLSLRWRIFLVIGLGRAIKDWEHAAEILKENESHASSAPNYLETAYYGRKWMNRFLLQMAAMKEIEGTVAEGSRQAAAQDIVKEQTQALVSTFLEKEAVVGSNGKKIAVDVKSFDQLMKLVQDMLAGYSKLTDEHLTKMSWLNPVLSSCIHTSNEDIRLSIQKLVERLH